MKLLHLADLHLGKRVNGFDLLDDQRFVLEQILDLCAARGVDAVALAGDLYDAPLPPAGAVLLLDWFLTELAARGIAVLAIAGNHDSAERLDYAARLLARQQVYIAGRFTGALPLVELPDAYGAVQFCLLPFVRTATVRHFLPGADISGYDSAVAAALATLPPAATGTRRVLLAHQMVTGGGAAPLCAGSESVAVGAALNVGTVDAIDAGQFAGFCYTALGHIHRPQAVGGDCVRYAGAPLCYSLDECGAEKSAVLITLGPTGAEPELLPLHPRRAMRHLTGPLARLTDPAHLTDTGDYIWATLTDDTPVPDAMARLRAAYPNAMKLDYALRAAAPGPRGAEMIRQKGFGALFDDFFAQQQGRPMTPDEAAALAELRKEAGE